jgi:hypothetical protein
MSSKLPILLVLLLLGFCCCLGVSSAFSAAVWLRSALYYLGLWFKVL